MANEEIKENVPPEEYVDPDAARAEDEDEAEPAPAGPAPIIKKKKLDADHAGAHGRCLENCACRHDDGHDGLLFTHVATGCYK